MKTVLLAQALISFTMALLMTGYATLLELGLSPDLVGTWLPRFAMGWPIAFLLSIPVGKLGFMLATRLAPPSKV